VASQAGCDYQPDVATLEIEPWGTVEAPSGGVAPPTAPLPGLATPFPSSQNPGQPATSSEAMELCEPGSMHGDEDVGYCRLPGGGSYLVWVQSGEVFHVEAGDSSLDEFQRAVTAREQNLSAIEARGLRTFLEAVGVGLALSWASVHCSPGGGAVGWLKCALASVAFLVAGLAVPGDATGLSMGTLMAALEEARANYHLCQIRQGAHEACLEAAGITEEMLEGTYGT